MKGTEEEIIWVLTGQGVGFIRFADITELPPEQNRGLPHVLSFGMALTPSCNFTGR